MIGSRAVVLYIFTAYLYAHFGKYKTEKKNPFYENMKCINETILSRKVSMQVKVSIENLRHDLLANFWCYNFQLNFSKVINYVLTSLVRSVQL